MKEAERLKRLLFFKRKVFGSTVTNGYCDGGIVNNESSINMIKPEIQVSKRKIIFDTLTVQRQIQASQGTLLAIFLSWHFAPAPYFAVHVVLQLV